MVADSTLGPVLVGGLVSTLLTGIVLLQFYIYCSNFPTDSAIVKTVAITVVTCQILAQFSICATIYATFVGSFGDMTHTFPNVFTISFGLAVFFGAITGHVSEAYFIYRLYKLMGKLWVAIVLWVIVAICFGSTMAFFAGGVTNSYTLRMAKDNPFVTGIFICAAAVDVATAVLLVGFMKSRGVHIMSETKTIMNKISLYAIQTSFATSMMAVLAAITLHASPGTTYVAFYMNLSAFFANALFASLNSRISIRYDSMKSGMTGSSAIQFTTMTGSEIYRVDTQKSTAKIPPV